MNFIFSPFWGSLSDRHGRRPVIAGTVFIAGKALGAGYTAATGTHPPKPDDLDAPVMRVVLFALATAAVTAIINVGIQRGVAKAVSRSPEPLAA